MRKFSYYFNETINSLRRQGLMVFAAVSTVFISLFLFGGALLIGKEVNLILDVTTEKVQVAVFLEDNISTTGRTQLYNMLQNMPEVQSVTYESKQQAYQRFKKIFANQSAITRNVTSQALPASFRVKLKDPSQYAVVKARVGGLPGVQDVVDQSQILKRFFGISHVLQAGALIAAAIMLISAAGLIGNTVRLGVFARRKEIGIMRLVGATNWFIRLPFIIEAVVEGILGAMIAIVGLFVMKKVFLDPLRNKIGFLPLLRVHDFAVTVPWLILIGVAVAIVASFVAMRRFLEV